jgi:hypothetical protein
VGHPLSWLLTSDILQLKKPTSSIHSSYSFNLLSWSIILSLEISAVRNYLMQLIVAGASGYLASEVIRQALSLPKITSIIALARRSVEAPDEYYLDVPADRSKLKSVVVKEYDDYPDEVKKEFAKADACIWYFENPSIRRKGSIWVNTNFITRTVAVTPSKSRSMEFEKVRKICQDYTLIGMKAMFEARENSATPFCFMYVSGTAAERDQTKTPFPAFMAQYSLMRVSNKSNILLFSKLFILNLHFSLSIGRNRKPSPILCSRAQRSN